MRHLPDNGNKWILHAIDHWSKFNFAYAIESKHATSVAQVLESHIFPYFGVPRILHSDNGREFINKVFVQKFHCSYLTGIVHYDNYINHNLSLVLLVLYLLLGH